ncbi:MAG TPA: sugar kinase [Xanthobacteraceae bacterium]|nr:sugar kinase [Xanthobacteraceae bacterium]
MNEKNSRVISVGEVMVELSRAEDGRFALAYGGDTFNTSVYLARAGAEVAYATALGDDNYSGRILDLAAAEGIGSELMFRVPGRMPGLYLIETDENGERHFSYWRDTAPARELFELPEWSAVAESLLSARMVYFSGITLSLYSNAGLGRFLAVLELAREKGAIIAFDGNYRPRGWRGDVARARTVYTEALKRVDIALPSFDDEATLWGDARPEATVERLHAFGIGEIVVKNAEKDALVAAEDVREWVPVPEVVEPVDTTAAGDGFNAAYLAARLRGETAEAAALAGHRLSNEVVQHRGAIIPRRQSAMH